MPATLHTVFSQAALGLLRSGVIGAMLLVSQSALAEAYRPLFSQEMLSGLDANTRARFAELERENHQRWRNRNRSAPDVSAAKRQHQETEAMLRRFEESRTLQKQAQAERASRTAEQTKKCEIVAAEIEELSAGGAFYETTPSGERRYLSDKELAARVKAQKKSYNKYCK